MNIITQFLMWLVNLAIWAICFLIGQILIPLALVFGWVQTRPSQTLPRSIITWSPSWMWLWGNEEDGLAATWYLQQYSNRPLWFNRYIWSAWRNSVDNQQRIKYLNLKVDANKIKSYIYKNGFFCTQGIYAGGQIFIGNKQINYGYALLPVMSTDFYVPGTRDIPYVGCHWSFGPKETDITSIERHS